jgi:hypothetical protein
MVAHILVRKLLHQLDFSQYTLGIYGVFKRPGDLFNSHFLPCFLVQGGDDHAVGPVANRSYQRVPGLNLNNQIESISNEKK